jgi:hypothetical protein
MKIGSDTAVTSTFTSDNAVECGFDASGAAHIQSILTFMYRDAAMAVFREYLANAQDSHVRAGTSEPVEVTLPTDFEPTLTVTDRGLGLSEQDILDVYGPYGTSTKRDRDDQVGAFGIGAKAAFTLASQFTVTGVKDGKTVTALFALNAEGVATVEIMSREATDAPNGVTVVVPVPDPAAMRQAADRLLAFWPRGTVRVDGAEPVYAPDTMLRVTDTLFADHEGSAVDGRRPALVREDAATGVTIVMGGIGYAASVAMLRTMARRLTEHLPARQLAALLAAKQTRLRLVHLAEIGEVDITPSREDLRDTPRTLDVLKRVLTTHLDAVQGAVETALDAEPNAMHAAMRMTTLKHFLPTGWHRTGVLWRGQRLHHEIGLPFPVIVRSTTPKSTRCTMIEGHKIQLGTPLPVVRVITGVDVDRERIVRRWANRYMTHHELDWLILVPTATMQVGWFTADPAATDAPIPAITYERFHTDARALPTVSAPRREPSYEVFAGGYHGVSQSWKVSEVTDHTATHGGRVLLTTGRYSVDPERQVVNDMLGPHDLVVALTGSQSADVFFRRFPNAVRLDDVVRQHARTLLDQATEPERHALSHNTDPAMQALQHEPVLRRIEPLRRMVEDYVAGSRAYTATPTQRRSLLCGAHRVLGTYPARPVAASEVPLLDLVLNQLRARAIATPLDEELVADLAGYLNAVNTNPTDSSRGNRPAA